MKRKLNKLSRRYASELRKHLKQRPSSPGRLRAAHGLGQQAACLGLETLDVARIHEGALARLEASSSKDGIIKQAEIFFKEAVTPIEKKHQAAVKANARLNQVNKRLDRRTMDLEAVNRSLKETIILRKAVEKALGKSGEKSQKLLEESDRLQKHLRHLTQKILTAHEDKRKEMSGDLQDEIAQTLLGINVRLLTLRKEAAANASGFKKEIAGTQRLADKAERSVKRFAREISKHHKA